MKKWSKYVIGAALVYGSCILFGGEGLSTNFKIAVQLGLFVGGFIFVFFGPVFFVLQMVGNIVISKLKPALNERQRAIILNMPALIAFVFLFIGSVTPMSQTKMRVAFQEHIISPVPPSVNVKGFRMVRGFNEGSYEILFDSSENDLKQLLQNGGYTLWLSNVDQEIMSGYQHEAQNLTSQHINLAAPGKVYTWETNSSTSRFKRNIIVGTNFVNVLFTENFN